MALVPLPQVHQLPAALSILPLHECTAAIMQHEALLVQAWVQACRHARSLGVAAFVRLLVVGQMLQPG